VQRFRFINSLNRLLDGRPKAASSCIDPLRPRLLVTRSSGFRKLAILKGPGVTLLSLRQDAAFAEVKGGFARQGWSGPVEQAPPQLRGWLALRDQFIHAPDQKTVRYIRGNEAFLFRF
jgi:hypothetical protein